MMINCRTFDIIQNIGFYNRECVKTQINANYRRLFQLYLYINQRFMKLFLRNLEEISETQKEFYFDNIDF